MLCHVMSCQIWHDEKNKASAALCGTCVTGVGEDSWNSHTEARSISGV